MSYHRTGDPIADFNRKDAEESRWLDSLPKCKRCGRPIQEENCFDLSDGPICEECVTDYVDENFKCSTEHFMS